MINNVAMYQVNTLINIDSSFYYVIPKYQREYTWSYKEWYALYDDITENDEGYFLGSIICINTGDSIVPKLEVIDGQQRLTTICLLLLAIYRRLSDYKSENDNVPIELALIRKALRNAHNQETHLILLPQIHGENRSDFSTVMQENGIIDYAKKVQFYGNRKISRCFREFLWKIDQDLADEENKAEKLL